MGYIYNELELRTKQDYIDQLKEIIAYRELDGQDFDFGTGLIVNEMSLGSEDAYYEMDMYSLEGAIEYWDAFPKPVKKKRIRPNRYARMQKHKKNLKKKAADENTWAFYPAYYNEGRYIKRYYRGKRSAYLKRQSSKIIRRYQGEIQMKGNKHKRVFDFWWELY